MSWTKLQPILAAVEKPARYIGSELNSVIKPKEEVRLRFALAFPDVYEIGTSYLGFQILYDNLNQRQGVQAERVFAPWPDMERQMRESRLPLYGLESKTALAEFDCIGFTLQYELGYTNILNMLDLSGLSLYASERQGFPLVIAGGPGAYNPEPLADFIDIFVIGEGEEVIGEIVEILDTAKQSRWDKEHTLEKMAEIPGLYVPMLYTPTYDDEGKYLGTTPKGKAPEKVKKRIVKDFSNLPLPNQLIVPLVQPVHDRVSIEICRGCARGCRFCQAGIIYRPVRERQESKLLEQGLKLLQCTGSNEVSLTSLSSADYSEIDALIRSILDSGDISVSLPSLRVDSYSVDLARLTRSVRSTGLTLAPEAGSQRLRDVINKNVRDEDIFEAARKAFENGWNTIKLYFMLGLPTETTEDIEGIVDISFRLEKLYREINGHTKRFRVNLGISTFVPKAHTPFQWSAQLNQEEVINRQRLLQSKLSSGKFKVQTTDWQESNLEAVLARGDRRVGFAIFQAWKKGCKFDAWSEHFRPDLWRSALEEAGIDTNAITIKPLDLNCPLPWDHIDIGVSKEFLQREYSRAFAHQITADCTLNKCSACGVCTAYSLTPFKRRTR